MRRRAAGLIACGCLVGTVQGYSFPSAFLPRQAVVNKSQGQSYGVSPPSPPGLGMVASMPTRASSVAMKPKSSRGRSLGLGTNGSPKVASPPEESPFMAPEELSMDSSVARKSTKYAMYEELGRAKLLTRAQEIELGLKIQQLVEMENVRSKLVEDSGREPTDSEWAEACGYEGVRRSSFRDLYNECLDAKQLMVRSNMRLVIAVAKRYSRMGVPLADLIQEGCLGLIRAAEKYDPHRGFKFSTYAAWWIQQAIFKAIAYNSRLIRLPVHVHNLLHNVRRARRELVAQLGHSPTDAQVTATATAAAAATPSTFPSSHLADCSSPSASPTNSLRETEPQVANYLNMPVERLKHYLRASRNTVSTEISAGRPGSAQPGEFVLGDTLESKDTPAPEDSAEMALFRLKLKEVMSELAEEERRVVVLRYGLDDGKYAAIVLYVNIGASLHILPLPHRP
ncbi:unnamed protein product [Chrysoparadoxa australica]